MPTAFKGQLKLRYSKKLHSQRLNQVFILCFTVPSLKDQQWLAGAREKNIDPAQ